MKNDDAEGQEIKMTIMQNSSLNINLLCEIFLFIIRIELLHNLYLTRLYFQLSISNNTFLKAYDIW